MGADADGLRRRLQQYAFNLYPVALDELADRMRPEAPISKAGPEEEGGSRSRGELRRSIVPGRIQLGFDRVTGELRAPVIQAWTTDKGAPSHFITATKAHGMLVFYSRNAGRVVFVKGKGGRPGRVLHPGNPPMNWWMPALQRHWPEALRVAAARTAF